MNILIVGNGFDLSHYLPTKYDHFMVAMDAIENWDISKGEMHFDDFFHSLYEKEDYFFGYTKAMYKTDDIKISIAQLQELKDQLKKNIWYRYFKYYQSNNQTWIDLEQKIQEALYCCSNLFNNIQNKLEENSKFSYTFKKIEEAADNKTIKLHAKDNRILSLLKILELKKLVSNSSVKVWEEIDFSTGENYTLQENDKFIINNDFIYENDQYMNYDFSKAIGFLNQQLNTFKRIFNNYLLNIIEPLMDQVKQNTLSINPDKVYSFNYTNTFSKLYSNDSHVSFLHGNSQIEDNLVLGVSELPTDIFKKYKAFGFTKYHQKLFLDTDYQFLLEDEVIKLNLKFWLNSEKPRSDLFYEMPKGIEKRTNIFIWGHSLDSSDEVYIKEIFSLNDERDTNVRLIIYYFNDEAKFALLANLLDILRKEKVEIWMKKGWLKFEKNPDIAKINGIQPVSLKE